MSRIERHPRWTPALDDVIALGRDGASEALLLRLKSHRNLGLALGADWEAVTSGLTEADLYDLLRGFVIAEDRLHWSGGSVSAAVWLARIFGTRCPHRWAEADKWIRHNCKNPWVSVSRHKFYDYEADRPMTTAERDVVIAAEHASHEAARLKRETEERELVARREAKSAAAKERRLDNLDEQRSSQHDRDRRLRELHDCEPVDRVCRVIRDRSVGLDFYPSEWGMLSPEELQRLPDEVITDLLERCQHKTGHTWRSVAALFRNTTRES